MSTLLYNHRYLLFVINVKQMKQEIKNELNRLTTSIYSQNYEEYVEPLMVEWQRSAIFVVSVLVKRGYEAYEKEQEAIESQ